MVFFLRSSRIVSIGTSPRIEGLITNALASMSRTCSGVNAPAVSATVRMRSSGLSVGYSSRISVELGVAVAKTVIPASSRDRTTWKSSAANRMIAATFAAEGLRGVGRIVDAAAVGVLRSRRGDDRVLGVVAERRNIERSFCPQSWFPSVPHAHPPQRGGEDE